MTRCDGYGKKMEVTIREKRKIVQKKKYIEMALLHPDVIFTKTLRRRHAHRTTWNDFGDT